MKFIWSILYFFKVIID